MKILNIHKDGKPTNAVYIGRPSPLGNPYVIGKDGTRDEVCDRYDQEMKSRLENNDPSLIKEFKKLNADTQLLCFCTPQRCHGESIIKYWTIWNERLYQPHLETITHINIYSKSKSPLGRLLSNFAHTPIDHHHFGHFESIEGFWYYIKSGLQYEVLRTLYGYEAKKVGKTFEPVFRASFQEDILSALQTKLNQHPDILKQLKESTLPLVHYYYFGSINNPRVFRLDDYKWIVAFFESCR